MLRESQSARSSKSIGTGNVVFAFLNRVAAARAVPAAGRSTPRPKTVPPPTISRCHVFADFHDACHAEQHVMSLLRYAGRLYSLDTLDSRFSSSTKTSLSPSDPATPSLNDAGYRKGRAGDDRIDKGASLPRWKSPEFMYHGLVFVVIVPLMFKTVYDVSKRKPPNTLYVLRRRLTPYSQLHTQSIPNLQNFYRQVGFQDA